MNHLIRAGAVIGVLIIAFVVLRAMPPPKSLADFGFHKVEDNEKEWASQPLRYADPSTCNACHQEQHSAWETAQHSPVSCESCHGPGQAHADTGAKVVVDTSRELCALCHARLLARPPQFPQVDLERHGEQAECVTCHDPHEPRLATAPLIPHTLEGRTDCLLCHDLEGFKPVPEDHAGRGTETCLSCHRGTL